MKNLVHIHGFILIILVFAISCTERESYENITNIHYSENEDLPMENFIDRIEIIPLETDSMNLIGQYHKIEFYDDFGGYLIVDKSKQYTCSQKREILYPAPKSAGEMVPANIIYWLMQFIILIIKV